MISWQEGLATIIEISVDVLVAASTFKLVGILGNVTLSVVSHFL